MNSGEPVHSLVECPDKPIDGKGGQEIMHRQSDYPIVSRKSMKVGGEKGIAGTAREDKDTPARLRTGVQMRTTLAFLTQRARENPKERFTSLAHLLTEDFLRACFWELKRDKAPGVDGVSVEEYEETTRYTLYPRIEEAYPKSLMKEILKYGSVRGIKWEGD